MEYTKTFTTNQKSQIDALYGENRKYMEDIIGRFKEKLALAIVEQLYLTPA
jgi:accessory colonization factor AcfC